LATGNRFVKIGPIGAFFHRPRKYSNNILK
jgi:hypothetical protein